MLPSLFPLVLFYLTTLVSSSPVPDADANPNPSPNLPTRSTSPKLFTVQSFQSPSPSGVGLTGYYLTTSKSGSLYLSPTAPASAIVFYVDNYSRAFLNTSPPTPVYLDTATGQLSSGSAPPPSALLVPFFHLGTGTTLYTEQGGYATEGSSVFQWVGSENSSWFACPLGGGKYALVKQMTVVNPNVGGCQAVELGALDYGG